MATPRVHLSPQPVLRKHKAREDLPASHYYNRHPSSGPHPPDENAKRVRGAIEDIWHYPMAPISVPLRIVDAWANGFVNMMVDTSLGPAKGDPTHEKLLEPVRTWGPTVVSMAVLPTLPKLWAPTRLLVFDEAGLPTQIHNLSVPIGRAFATEAEALAAMPEQGHILQVVVRERGKIAGQWWEVSEQGINTLGHTEQKLLKRIGFLGPEVSIEMRGIFPPCPWAGGCMNTLQLAAESGAKVTYRQLNGATYMFQREGSRRLDWDAASGWFK